MDELRGPNIQIVLHVKEGLGFGFLKTSFVVSGALNGYVLETDPAIPCHAPIFDAELVWEADKRRFRSLRVQNVPVKVEVFALGTQGRKDKVGYLLLSLLGAQPCPANKMVDIKHAWHKLLGVKSEGKCCHPQLLLSLSIEDRVNTLTPRNELRMFHSNEIAYPSSYAAPNATSSRQMTIDEYLQESNKTVSSLDLQPKLLCDEGLIQIGEGTHLFVLSFVIGAVENIDMLLPENLRNDAVDCYVAYSVFTHNIMTDRVAAITTANGSMAQFNQRTSLRICGSLRSLSRYFSECPYLVTKVCCGDKDVGIGSLDLRKLIPTDDHDHFLTFCNRDKSLALHERCFLRAREPPLPRRPYVDVEMRLACVGVREEKKANNLTARSATELKSDRKKDEMIETDPTLECKSGSCTELEKDVGGIAYTNISSGNTARYKNAAGESIIQTNEIVDLIRKMYDSFTVSQEKLLSKSRTFTSDVQVQCEPEVNDTQKPKDNEQQNIESLPIKLDGSKSDTCIKQGEKVVSRVLTFAERDAVMQRLVDELEDWKEKQQELYKIQLKRKEEYHLELLSKEWSKKRSELEHKLNSGMEQCRHLAADLSRATEDFRLRAHRNTNREKKLLEAKQGLESHYTAKYQELREASQKMEDDMNHQLKLKDMRIEELETKVQQLEKQVDVLKSNLENSEKDAQSKYSGLTKDQTASLIQELRCLEEKLDAAVQSKAFFKEQWGRCVRELHASKLRARTAALARLRGERRALADAGLDTIPDQEEISSSQSALDMNKLKDDFYVDILANTPGLESHSMISTTGIAGMDMFDDINSLPKNPTSEKLNELIAQRDRLIQQETPDETLLKQLNHDIRNLLLNCGT